MHVTKSAAQSAQERQPPPGTLPSSTNNASPIYGITIPPGYRDWKLIAVDQLVTDKVDQLRAQLGNEIAGSFPGAQSFVVGSAVNVQFMIKDSKKYAATGGWGFADFKDGKLGDEALHKGWPLPPDCQRSRFCFRSLRTCALNRRTPNGDAEGGTGEIAWGSSMMDGLG